MFRFCHEKPENSSRVSRLCLWNGAPCKDCTTIRAVTPPCHSYNKALPNACSLPLSGQAAKTAQTHTYCWNAGQWVQVFFFFKQRNKRITANVYVVWHCQFSYCVWTCSGTDELLLVYFSPLFLQIKKETKKRHQTVIRAWRDISTTMQAPSWIKNWCNNNKGLNCDLTVCINCWTCYWMFI